MSNFIDTNKQKIKLSFGIEIEVRKKLSEIGTTPYVFSYSFKGEQKNNPINPNNLLLLAKELSNKSQKKNQTIIAFDRGGTALGVAISIVTNLPLYIAFSYYSRLPKEGIYWSETGAGKHLGIPHLAENTHVILVDDEINTGKTFLHAIKTLNSHKIIVDELLVVTEVDKGNKSGRYLIEQKNCRVNSLYKIPEPIFDKKLNDYIFP